MLWASTGTKNPGYSDLLYVENLIGPNTVNTIPPATLEALRHHGRAQQTVDQDLAAAKTLLRQLPAVGVDMKAVTNQLKKEGVAAFAKSFETLLAALSDKCRQLKLN
jgi:transaldolase